MKNFQFPSRHRDRMTTRCQRGFTLIEMLVVIGIIGLLAAMIVGISSVAGAAKVRSRVKAELAAMETVIRQYQKKYGFYPPDNGNVNNTGTNQLFYELTGTDIPTTLEFRDLTGTTLTSVDVQNAFSTKGFINSGSEKQNFFSNLKPSGYAPIPLSSPAIHLLVVPYKKEGPGGEYNPWHYRSSKPEHNSDGFDLWAEVSVNGKTETIGNWKD